MAYGEEFLVKETQYSKPSEFKKIDIKYGGVDWKKALFKSQDSSAYIAPNLVLSAGENDQISFSASTTYVPILENIFNKLRNSTAGKLITGVQEANQAFSALLDSMEQELKLLPIPAKARFQTSMARLPAWDKTEPLDIGSFKFKLHMGMADVYDARTEVYNPALALFSANLPIKRGGFLYGPVPGPAYTYGLLAGTGVKAIGSIRNAMSNSYSLERALSDVIQSVEGTLNKTIGGERGSITLQWGNFSFPTFTVDRTKITFSKETDSYGFPIWAEVSWDNCKTLHIAHMGIIPFKDASAKESTDLVDSTKESAEREGGLNQETEALVAEQLRSAGLG